MLLAGLCNAAAFLTLTLALQLAGLVYVNALNASQTAMAAVAGVVVFGEAVTPWLVLGVLLTAGGFLLMRGGRRGGRSAGQCTGPDAPVEWDTEVEPRPMAAAQVEL
jgi:drug/metabolite transporter (DMT)-like permease